MPCDMRPESRFLRQVLDAMPTPVFVVDAAVCVRDMNAAAQAFLHATDSLAGIRLCGEILQCVHALNDGHPCGETPFCSHCVVRDAVTVAGRGEPAVRRWTRMQLVVESRLRDVCLLVTATQFQTGGEALTLLVLEDVTDVTELRALLPVCSICGKVRSEGDDRWESLHDYLRHHTGLRFTHGVCPDCIPRLDDAGRQARAKAT